MPWAPTRPMIAVSGSAVSPAFCSCASSAWPSLRASAAACSPTRRSRTWSFTSASGSVRAGEYSTMRADASWLGPTSTASVLRLLRTASLPNTASSSLAEASGPVAPGAGVRCTVALRFSSLSLSITGCRLSACSYTVLVNCSATSA